MGIQLGSQFDPNMALPLDSRLVVANVTARDAIPSGLRYDGMIVYAEASTTTYQLKGGITNAHWEEFGGGGTGAVIDNTNKTWSCLAGTNPLTITTDEPHGLKPLTYVKLYGDLAGTGQVLWVIDDYNFKFPGNAPSPGSGYYVAHDANVVYDRVSDELKLAPPGDALMEHYHPQVAVGLAFNKTLTPGLHHTTKADVYVYGPYNIDTGAELTISAGTTFTIL